MKRREFCRQIAMTGSAIALAPLLNGCAAEADPTHPIPGRKPANGASTATANPTRSPGPAATAPSDLTPTPLQSTPSATEETPPHTATVAAPLAAVALVKTSNRALGVQRAIRLLGSHAVRGSRVLLKPNYNSADAAPASTHPDTLRALVTELNEMGARAITVGERSGMGDTRTVLAQCGVFDLADELGFDTVLFDELDEAGWVIHQPRDAHWSSGFAVPRILLDSECVVQTCNLKTHGFGGHFTLSLKNSVGFVARSVRAGAHNYMTELHNSPYQRQMIAEVNTAYTPTLIVLDGVAAFLDGGPATGKLANPGIMLAGTDPVAMDAVGVAVLRLFGTTVQVSKGTVFEQAQIARAVELGLGVDAPARITFLTDDAESAAYAEQISRFLS